MLFANLNNLVIVPPRAFANTANMPPLIYSPQTKMFLTATTAEIKALQKIQKQTAGQDDQPAERYWLTYYKSLKNSRPELQKFILHCFSFVPAKIKNNSDPYNMSISFFGDSKCNLKCLYCFNRNISPAKEKPFSLHFAADVLESIYKQAHQTIAMIDFNYSGEPLLFFDKYKKLWALNQKIAKKYKKTPANMGIVTNGLLLNDKIIDWLRKHNCWLGLSLDGGAEYTNAGRGEKTFERAIANYQKIFARPEWTNERSVHATISGLNPDVSRVFTELWDTGFRQIYIKPLRSETDQPYALNKKNLPKVLKGYRKLFALLAEDIAQGRLERLLSICNRFDYAGKFLGRIMINRSVIRRCGGGYGMCSVRNNGDAYPCDTYAGRKRNKLGNIYKRVNWDKNLAPPVDELESCRFCKYRYLCGGPCPVWRDINNGDISVECAFNKALITECFRLAALIEQYPQEKKLIHEHFRYHL